MSEDYANRTESFILLAGAVPQSPSLFRQEAIEDEAPAYELKFLLNEEQARTVEHHVRGRLAPDPHADPALGGAYRTTSLYTDAPQFDVFHRVGEFARSKFRVRRYGQEGPAFLERKDKTGDRVRKFRVSVPTADLAVLTAPGAPANWPGDWFHHQLSLRQLRPVCRIGYDRIAYLGSADGGAVRITFDRNVRGEVADGWHPHPVGPSPELLPGEVICEFKFRSAMPLLFKEIVQAHSMNPTTVSKYRRFVQAAGIAPATGGYKGGSAADG